MGRIKLTLFFIYTTIPPYSLLPLPILSDSNKSVRVLPLLAYPSERKGGAEGSAGSPLLRILRRSVSRTFPKGGTALAGSATEERRWRGTGPPPLGKDRKGDGWIEGGMDRGKD